MFDAVRSMMTMWQYGGLKPSDPVDIDPVQFGRFTPSKSQRLWNGNDRHYFEFENGYGGSVICGLGSYGGDSGLWELGVFRDGDLCYDTPITDDVIGYLTVDGVADLLEKIEALPKKD